MKKMRLLLPDHEAERCAGKLIGLAADSPNTEIRGVMILGWPTNNAKTGGLVDTCVIKADFVTADGLCLRAGNGWLTRIFS